MGLLAGKTPTDLGVRNGRLADVRTDLSNSVSSYATTPYHRIEPLPVNGDALAVFDRAVAILRHTPGTRVIEVNAQYVYAQCESQMLKFIDDLELLLDERSKVIHVRSASRLGRKDFSANRNRVEALRKQLG
jgi:uncharacterized protein (DUF1499 family)